MLKTIRKKLRQANKVYKPESSTVNFFKKFHKRKNIRSAVSSILIFTLSFGSLFFVIEPRRVFADATEFLNFAANAAVTTSAGNNNGFSNGGNAAADDGVFATDDNSGILALVDGCSSFPQIEDDQHDFHDFNISIASGSTINGIEVPVNAFVAQPSTGDDQLCVALSWNGGVDWTTAKGTGELAAADGTTYTLGGSADTWGRVWSVAELSNANFRIRVMPDSTGDNTPDYSLDYIGLKVHYTPPQTTTLGDGTDGSNATVAPGAPETEIGRFTLSTNTGTDTVTALTVTLGPTDAFTNVATIDVETADGVSKCSAAPESNTVSLTSCGIAVTTTATEYKIMITPKTHGNMAAPVSGASYNTVATVTDWTGTNVHAGADTDSATITIDNLSPANVTAANGSVGNTQVSLSWTNPTDADFEEVVVLQRASSAVTDTPVEGTSYATSTTIGSSVVVCEGNIAACSDIGLSNGTAYHYKIFAKDSRNNYSDSGLVPTGSPITPSLSNPAPSEPEQRGSSRPPDPSPPPVVAAIAPTDAIPENKLTEAELQIKLQLISLEIRRIAAEVAKLERETFTEAPMLAKEEFPKVVQSEPGPELKPEAVAMPRKSLLQKPSEITIGELPAPLPLPQLEVEVAVRPLDTGWDKVAEKLSRGEGELTRQAQEIINRGDGWAGRIARRVEVAKLAVGQGVKNARSSVKNRIAATEDSAVALRDTLRERLGSQLEGTSKLVSVMPPLPTLTVEPRLAKENIQSEDVIILQSGELELVASQDKPVQTITSFRFTAKIKPSKPAKSVGGTFKYNDSDRDGVWTAEGQLPPTSGRFALNTRISYADGSDKELRVTTLIDPEGYIYEKTGRGELRIEGSKATLWQRAGKEWVRWPAEKFNQKNPQITDRTGEYSFLAPEGEYYIEITAKDYKPYKGQPFKLEEASPVNENIELQYNGPDF